MTTIATAAPPRHSAAVALARGFLTGAVVGGSLAAFVVGIVIERVPLIITALGVLIGYFLLLLLVGAPRRAREAGVAPCVALAKIESVRADETGDTDVPVRFELTVAPDDAAAYRVEFKQDINVAYLRDYRPGGLVAVRYPPDRPWLVGIVKRPTPYWEQRLAGAALDSVPGPAITVSEPAQGCGAGALGFLGLLLAAAFVVLAFRTDLAHAGDDGARQSATTTTTTTTTTSTTSTTTTSMSGTVALPEGRSMLDSGELTQAVDSLVSGGGGVGRTAITVVVQDRQVTVVFSPDGTQAMGFDPRTLPYGRFPALVRDAETTAGIGEVRSWQISAFSVSGSVEITVTVTGSEGTASVVADGRGDVVRRTGSGQS